MTPTPEWAHGVWFANNQKRHALRYAKALVRQGIYKRVSVKRYLKESWWIVSEVRP